MSVQALRWSPRVQNSGLGGTGSSERGTPDANLLWRNQRANCRVHPRRGSGLVRDHARVSPHQFLDALETSCLTDTGRRSGNGPAHFIAMDVPGSLISRGPRRLARNTTFITALTEL